MLHVIVHTADIQDRDGAPDLPKAIQYRFPWLRHVFADGGYAGAKLRGALKGQGEWTIEIIKRSDIAKGWEQSISSATTWAYIANVRILTRRLARYRWA